MKRDDNSRELYLPGTIGVVFTKQNQGKAGNIPLISGRNIDIDHPFNYSYEGSDEE